MKEPDLLCASYVRVRKGNFKVVFTLQCFVGLLDYYLSKGFKAHGSCGGAIAA